MNILFSTTNLSLYLKVLTSFLLAKLLWIIISFFALEVSPLYIKPNLISPPTVLLANMFLSVNNGTSTQAENSSELENKITLLSIIKSNKNGGYILIKENGKSITLSIDEKFENYIFVAIEDESAIFSKDGIRHKVSLKVGKNSPLAVEEDKSQNDENNLIIDNNDEKTLDNLEFDDIDNTSAEMYESLEHPRFDMQTE